MLFRRAVLVAVCVCSLGLFAASAQATTSTTGVVSGTVKDHATNAPLPNICVSLSSGPNYYTARTSTGVAGTPPKGTYSITGVQPGFYSATFSDCNGTGYISHYDNRSVAAGSTTTVDALLDMGGKITGTVTNNASPKPAPLANICVQAVPQGGGFIGYSAQTVAPSGTYTIMGLPTGYYTVSFTDCRGNGYISQTYPGPVFVNAPTTTKNINAQLVLGGSVAGTVLNNAPTRDPLPNMCVSASNAGGGFGGGTATTDANGQYTITGLAPGSYTIYFSDCSYFFSGPSNVSGYIPQYYNNKPTQPGTPVSVTAGKTTPLINATLVLGGTITGTVKNTKSVALPNMCVAASLPSSGGNPPYNAVTDASGTYTIKGLPTGSYSVHFTDCSGNNRTGYVPQWFNNKPTSPGTPVPVTAGKATALINAVLALGGTITGTVTDKASAPLANICVSVSSSSGSSGYATSNASGQYTIKGLLAVTGSPATAVKYTVGYSDCGGSGYTAHFYNGTATGTTNPSLATGVTVTSGGTTTLVAQQMAHP